MIDIVVERLTVFWAKGGSPGSDGGSARVRAEPEVRLG